MTLRVLFVAGVWATMAAAPAIATTHHHHASHTTHHGAAKSKSSASSHHGKSSHAAKSAHAKSSHGKSVHADKKHGAGTPARAPAPGGAISVGSGGTKLFCAGRASPLLVRKATQGSGTTVTVICR